MWEVTPVAWGWTRYHVVVMMMTVLVLVLMLMWSSQWWWLLWWTWAGVVRHEVFDGPAAPSLVSWGCWLWRVGV